MRTSDFDYNLPQELIAQTPLEPRDSSRLLVMRRDSGLLEHRGFGDLLEYLRADDLMVFNQSRVLPARILGYREDTGGKVELLLLHRESPGVWRALAKPGRRLRTGVKIILQPAGGRNSLLHKEVDDEGVIAKILESHPDGMKTIRFESEEEIAGLGEMPLPPYIHQALTDLERYQTVYSKDLGSAASPTAGLHFTQELLAQISAIGVELAFVTLHVGLDTFRPVQDEDPTNHQIHTEYFHISQDAAEAINNAKEEGRRVIAVGTTSVRVLEYAAQVKADGDMSQIAQSTGQADLFILPGYRFRTVDALITNFHLPRSTLLMLVSAFAEADSSTSSGRDMVLAAYAEAIQQKYRFYSFGDGMLVL